MDSIKILLVFVCGFVLAQAIKTVVGLMKGDKMPKDFGQIIAYMSRSGGMPSGHAASFVGAATMIGLMNGFDSAIFALAVCMSLIVIYDAINVRYAVGEQGKVMNEIIEKEGLKKAKLRLVEGHTILQVLVGSILGMIIALIVWQIF